MDKAVILDGKKISRGIISELREKTDKIGAKIKLAAVLVGDNPASLSFLRIKKEQAKKAGIDFKLYKFSTDISTKKLRKQVVNISSVKSNTGVIIQLPLPASVNVQSALNAIPESKDVDVLSEKSLGKFYTGRLQIMPPTVSVILRLLSEYDINVKSAYVALIGAGRLVGRPLSIALSQRGATVALCDEFTKDIAFFTKKADIIVSAVGKKDLITSSMVKQGAVVIDAGFVSVDNKICGDVDYDAVSKKASYITPVPGGVGPMTVAAILENLFFLYRKNP